MVEIIPKQIKIFRWQKILFYFSVFFLLAVILGYLILSSLEKRSEIYLQNLEERMSKGRTSERISLEKEILAWQEKIKDFSPLLEQHILSSKFFQFLEEKSHPKIFFSQLNLNLKAQKAVLSGQSDSFLTLGQQILIFEKEPLIGDLSLFQVSISKEGKIEFGLNLSFEQKIFQ